MIIGIDASRNKSGGAVAHIKGIINEGINPKKLGISKIHLWSYDSLLDQIEDKEWLVKHSPSKLKGNILKQVLWQKFELPKEAKEFKIDSMLYTDASASVGFFPCIVMSRDMLSFEKGQMRKFGFGLSYLRLLIIKYMQIISLKKATGALFLSRYASSVIMNYTGKISNYRVIPHGVGQLFGEAKVLEEKKKSELYKIIYVSNSSFYKHQWNIVEAISKLRIQKINIELLLVGANKGVAKNKLYDSISKFDAKNKFVTITDYLEHKEIIKLTLDSDIFMFASSCENMPNTLIEGMRLGMPILCSNRGPMPEVLKEAGLYFDPENIDSIMNVTRIAISDYNKLIPKATEAKKIASQYSWLRCSEETYNFLIDIKKNG